MKKTTTAIAIVLALLLFGGCGPLSAVSGATSSSAVSSSQSALPAPPQSAVWDEKPRQGAEPYGYMGLAEESRVIYDEIKQGLIDHAESIDISPVTEDGLTRIYDLIWSDCPELFWVDFSGQVSYQHQNGVVVTFRPAYLMDRATRNEMEPRLESAAVTILAGVPHEEGDYGAVRYLHNTIIETTDYDETAPNAHNLTGVLLDGRAVCEGYTKAFQYLCGRLGIPTITVRGNATGDDGIAVSHSWNMVWLEGDYYHIDLTWDDPVYEGGSGTGINYTYLNVTEAEILRTHSYDSVYALPAATATACNYFVREGLLFASYEELKAALVPLAAARFAAGTPTLEVKLGSEAAFTLAMDALSYDAPTALGEAGRQAGVALDSGVQIESNAHIYIIRYVVTLL